MLNGNSLIRMGIEVLTPEEKSALGERLVRALTAPASATVRVAVECRICHKSYKAMATHLRNAHQMKLSDYNRRFKTKTPTVTKLGKVAKPGRR